MAVATTLCLCLTAFGCSLVQDTAEERPTSKPFPKRFDLNGDGSSDFYRDIVTIGNYKGGASTSTEWLTSGGEARGRALSNIETGCPFFRKGILVKPYPDRAEVDIPTSKEPIRWSRTLGLGSQRNYGKPWRPVCGGVDKKYAGLKMFIEGELHYGWAQVSIRSRNDPGKGLVVTLHDQAVSPVPGQPIRTGEVPPR